jgi:POT family proton-dependent oligopeptide transporter
MFYHYQKILLVKLLELYSFYSLRSVLVIIFVLSLGFPDKDAFLIYTTFVIGGDIISIIGGYFGDKLLTRRISWVIGSIFSIFGYLYAYKHFTPETISVGLIFSGIGLGLCRCNSNVIINDYIQQEIQKDERHNHNGIFHVTTILALFLGFVINGFVLKYGDPSMVFISSAGAFFLSLLIFLFFEFKEIKNDFIITFHKNYKKITQTVFALILAIIFCKSLYLYQNYITILILIFVGLSTIFLWIITKKYPSRDRQSVLSLLLYVPFYLIYLSFEKQLDLGFSLFLLRNVDKSIFGYQIPSQLITSFFSISILLVTYIFYKKSVYSYLKHYSVLIYGLLCSLFYFLINYISCIIYPNSGINMIFPIFSLFFLGLADVLIVPRMYSLCRNVPENIKSISASLMMLSHGSGFYIAGQLAKFIAIDKNQVDLTYDILIYKNGFLYLIFVNLVVLVGVFIITRFHIGGLLIRK